MGNQFDFIICARKVEDGKFTSEPGELTFLKVPAGKAVYDPDDAMASRDRWRKQVFDAADGALDEVTGTTGDVLIFVHGYNNDIATVLTRTRMLREGLAEQGWKGGVVSFDWPSANNTLNYLEDRSDAAEVAWYLVDQGLGMLVDAQFPQDGGPACRLNVHMIGHSTGAYVIQEAFCEAEKRGMFYGQNWRIGQVAFIGGDVSQDSLRVGDNRANALYKRIMRLTNYSNGCDKVLGISNAKRLGAAPRAGRVGLCSDCGPKAVNVDCTDYFNTLVPKDCNFVGTFNHSWHIGNPVFALDLAMTLEGAIDRNYLPTRSAGQTGLKLVPGQRPQYQDDWDKNGK